MFALKQYVCRVSLHIDWKLDLPIKKTEPKSNLQFTQDPSHKVAIRIEWSKIPACVVSYHATGVLSYVGINRTNETRHKVCGCHSCWIVFHVLQLLPIRLVDLQ